MHTNVRKASLADARRISELNEAVQSVHALALPDVFKPYNEFSFAESVVVQVLGQSNAVIFVAQINEDLVGYLYVEVVEKPESSLRFGLRTLFIHQMAVEPKSQRTGVGRALMEAARQFAKDNGIAEINVDFWSFNDAARKVYASQGFAPQREYVSCLVSALTSP